MSPLQPIDRDELIGEFWNSVRQRLIVRFDKNPNEADFGIGQYRSDTERRGIGEAVYNQGVDRTAEVVVGVIDKGMPPLTRDAEFWDLVRNHLIHKHNWRPELADREIKFFRASNDDKENLGKREESIDPRERAHLLHSLEGPAAEKVSRLIQTAKFWDAVHNRLIEKHGWAKSDQPLDEYRLFHQPRDGGTTRFDHAEINDIAEAVVKHFKGS